jgi:hypothetical protein
MTFVYRGLLAPVRRSAEGRLAASILGLNRFCRICWGQGVNADRLRTSLGFLFVSGGSWCCLGALIGARGFDDALRRQWASELAVFAVALVAWSIWSAACVRGGSGVSRASHEGFALFALAWVFSGLTIVAVAGFLASPT